MVRFIVARPRWLLLFTLLLLALMLLSLIAFPFALLPFFVFLLAHEKSRDPSRIRICFALVTAANGRQCGTRVQDGCRFC
jgi:hypothetical protein